MWKELTEYIIPLRLYVWFLTASSQIMEPNDEEAEPGMMSFPVHGSPEKGRGEYSRGQEIPNFQDL